MLVLHFGHRDPEMHSHDATWRIINLYACFASIFGRKQPLREQAEGPPIPRGSWKYWE